MIVTEFQTCIVCGEDVLCAAGMATMPMCSTHSLADKLKALDGLSARINLTRKEIERGNA